MSTTIFCTFEQQDMADLAVGRLRSEFTGIRSIHYIAGFSPQKGAAASWFTGGGQATVFPMPSRPINVKIVCSDAISVPVKARLVNMRAYQIITTR